MPVNLSFSLRQVYISCSGFFSSTAIDEMLFQTYQKYYSSSRRKTFQKTYLPFDYFSYFLFIHMKAFNKSPKCFFIPCKSPTSGKSASLFPFWKVFVYL